MIHPLADCQSKLIGDGDYYMAILCHLKWCCYWK